jgi:hypothetical protein
VAAGTAAAAAGASVLPRVVRAAELPHLSTTDPMAQALSYTDDASTTKNAKHVAGDDCANCQFYQG